LTVDEKKEQKRLYDIEYRKKNREKIKKRKAEAFKLDYAANPEKYREQRRKRYPEHLKYLQSDRYKAWKKKYDQEHRAKKKHGEFWESAILLKKISDFVDNRAAKIASGNYGKSQKRKRKSVLYSSKSKK